MLGGSGRTGSRTPRVRRGGKAKPAPAGHAAPPGTGPAGETCGSCTYMEDFHYRNTYHKCRAREGAHWKGGRASDVRPLDAACDKWAASIRKMHYGGYLPDVGAHGLGGSGVHRAPEASGSDRGAGREGGREGAAESIAADATHPYRPIVFVDEAAELTPEIIARVMEHVRKDRAPGTVRTFEPDQLDMFHQESDDAKD